MTSAATAALFALAALVTVATPGPTVLLALSNGSRHGLSGAAPGIAGALLSVFSALLPQFIEPAAPQAAQYATLGLIFVLIDGAAMAAYAMLGVRWVSSLGSRGATFVNRSCGAALTALAAMLAVAPHRTS
ncbi:MAG: hypothetical protein JNJ89_15350 [Rubrivivax sp.]|nr:hypothetical protein [Rubrivivax sp.]